METTIKGVFAQLADDQSPKIQTLLESGVHHGFCAGDVLFAEGQNVDHLLDIVSGIATVSRNGSNGQRQILGFIGARQFLGAASTPRYPNSVVALTKVEAIAYPKAKLQSALESSSDFARNFQQALVKIIEARDDHLFAIGQHSAPQRLASFLLHLRTAQAHYAPDGPRDKSEDVKLPMTRGDIADYLGLTVETVSRAFSNLKQESIIEFTNSRECQIVDIGRLREYGGRDEFTEYRGAH